MCVCVCVCVFNLASEQLLMVRVFLISFSGRNLTLYTKVRLSPALLPDIPPLSSAKTNGTYEVTIKDLNPLQVQSQALLLLSARTGCHRTGSSFFFF